MNLSITFIRGLFDILQLNLDQFARSKYFILKYFAADWNE